MMLQIPYTLFTLAYQESACSMPGMEDSREREEKCYRMEQISVIIMVSSGSILVFIARPNKTGQQNGHGYPDQQLLRIT